MALRNIVKLGDPVLKKTSRSVLNFDERLHVLLDDMRDTLIEAQGAGLAAPQVGVLRRVCLVDVQDEDGIIELVNPVIVDKKGVQNEVEGCLSIPGESGVTIRPMWVKVKAQDRFGNTFFIEGEGLKARAFCHEIDHLDGILYKERLIK